MLSMTMDMTNVLLNTSLRGALGILAHFISKTTYDIRRTPPTTIMAISDGFRHPCSAYVLSENGSNSNDQPNPNNNSPNASISCKFLTSFCTHVLSSSTAGATIVPRGPSRP